jgi:hypothetical protein
MPQPILKRVWLRRAPEPNQAYGFAHQFGHEAYERLRARGALGPPVIVAHAQVLAPCTGEDGSTIYELADVRTLGIPRIRAGVDVAWLRQQEDQQLAELRALLDDLGVAWDQAEMPAEREP